MAVQYRTRGFVFKREDAGEADQFFSIFTEDFGKIKILGRAIRKIKSKLRAGINLFYFSEIEFIQGKTYKTLTDAAVLKKPKINLDELEFLEKIANVVDKLIKGEEKDERIYNLLFKAIFKARNREFYKLEYYYFFWQMVSILGYQLDLYNCSKCHQKLSPEILNFSAESHGIICLRCSDDSIKDKIKISPEAVKVLRIIQEENWDLLAKIKVKDFCLGELEEVSESYLSYLKNLL